MKVLAKKYSSLLLVLMLVILMAFTTGCKEKTVSEPEIASHAISGGTLGEGSTEFTFIMIDIDGNETDFTIKTDETTVGAALLGVDLITGDVSEYGIYVKSVNGITADWDVDKTYWAFYIDGEYAMTGVDSTNITAGSTYTFKVEK